MNKKDYISFKKMIKQNCEFPNDVLERYLYYKNTTQFLGEWEIMHNPNFNQFEYKEYFLRNAGLNAYIFPLNDWITKAKAIGFYYDENNILYVHKEIAIDICCYHSVRFRILLFKEYLRNNDIFKNKGDEEQVADLFINSQAKAQIKKDAGAGKPIDIDNVFDNYHQTREKITDIMVNKPKDLPNMKEE